MSDHLAPDQIADEWSEGAAGYADSFAPFTEQFAGPALDLMGLEPARHLLDVAAGSGVLAHEAATRGHSVVASDFAPGMVELMERRFADLDLPVEPAEMDGQDLPVEANSFDAAASMFGLMFFPDIHAGLTEMARVTRPGGKVMTGTWSTDGFRLVGLVGEALASSVPKYQPSPNPPRWARVGDPESLERSLADAGLVDVEVHTITRPFFTHDSERFFMSLPTWSPPVKPLFESLDTVTMSAAMRAYVAAVQRLDPDGIGIPADALIGIGRVPN